MKDYSKQAPRQWLRLMDLPNGETLRKHVSIFLKSLFKNFWSNFFSFHNTKHAALLHTFNLFYTLASTICSFIGEVTITSWEVMVTWEVIITSNNVTICSLLQVTVTSKNFQKFFSISNDVKLPKMPKKAKKNFQKFWKFSFEKWRSLLMTPTICSLIQVTVTSLKVIITS